jgi:L-fuconolactonase
MIDFPIIDSHIHLLDQHHFGYAWTAGAPKLRRDWTASDLAAYAKPYVIEGFVFVEVDVDVPQYLDEAMWVDRLAKSEPRLRGCVACLPLERGKIMEPEIAAVAALPIMRGVRRLIQSQPDPEFATRPGFLEAVKLLAKYHLSFDICILHHQFPAALALVRQCPEVNFVLDHIGKPGIKADLLDPWRQHVREMAALPNVVCKLSGVMTEADHKTWTREQLRPYIDHVIACFGTDRVLFGGDWPVSELAGSYAQWVDVVDWATEGCTRSEKLALFRRNAIKAYRLEY